MPDDLRSLPATPHTLGEDVTKADAPARPHADLAQKVLRLVRHAQEERTTWMQLRADRLAKYRGWTAREEKTFPWIGASNQHVPILAADSLRVKAGLFNAVMGIRPVMTPKTLRRELRERGERATHLIDHQVFSESDGERRIGQWIDGGVDDGTAFAESYWARREATVTRSDVYLRPGEPEEDFAVLMPAFLTDVVFGGRVPTTLERKDKRGRRWVATFPPTDPAKDEPTEVTIRITEPDDTRIEVTRTWKAITYDGPVFLPMLLEDLVAPMRSENLQPVTEENPNGAPWVARFSRVRVDEIRRGTETGFYDQLTEEDLDAIAGTSGPRVPTDLQEGEQDLLKRQADAQAGLTAFPGQDESREWVTLVKWFGPTDLDEDGLDEEAVAWVILESETLCRLKALTQVHPGLPVRRPLEEWRYIEVPGQLYGIGVLELGEGLHDFIHIMLNQTVDYGAITNLPAGTYRASSGLKPETLHLSPGEFIPVDTPGQDLVPITWPSRDQSFGLNMVAFGLQMMDRLIQIGPLQQGQVPTGKASALRTVGTTMAILQQGAAMPEQVLRRLFRGLATVWADIHALNTRHLPRKKEYLVAGKPLDHEDAYGMIDDPQEIAIPIAFDFQATLLNTNKGLVSQALMAVGSALVSPLFFQLGLVTPEHVYNWGKDLIQANTLDPARYLQRPQGMPEGPRLMAEEAIGLLLQGQMPQGATLEPPEQHYQKVLQWTQSPEFALLNPAFVPLLQQYLQMLQQQIQQMMQQQQMMQAAAQLSQAMGQGGGQGGVDTTMQAPDTQMQAPTMAESMGGGQRGNA